VTKALQTHRARLQFRHELLDFLRFVRSPRVAPRLPGQALGQGGYADWFPAVSIKRLLQWAALLWTINLLVLGPLAIMAAGAGGATHRLNIHAIPWLTALLWAPVVEELVFRYALRRPGVLLWLVPLSVIALFMGPRWYGIALVACLLLACWVPYLAPANYWARPLRWSSRRLYLTFFPWVFHLACVAFAGLHLYNFQLAQTPWWLLPALVLPQWLTGLVLGWLRVRRGMGAAILLHAIFNAGPLAMVWLVLRLAPEMAY
jgi:hypothetical protein